MKNDSSNGSLPATEISARGLAPPGAGVPAIERFVGRMLVAVRRWRRSSEAIRDEFKREQAAIAKLYRPLDEDDRTRAVLIPRLRGLEDSSRCWSVHSTPPDGMRWLRCT